MAGVEVKEREEIDEYLLSERNKSTTTNHKLSGQMKYGDDDQGYRT